MDDELKAKIDSLSQIEMGRIWRFSENEPMLQGEAGKYFYARFKSLGFFTPAISKQLGWGRRML